MNPIPERELIARAVVLNRSRLLVNRGTMKNGAPYCALPGGHVDGGESCIAALEREMREELEAVASVGDLCFVCESIYEGRTPNDTPRHELTLFFWAEIEDELREDNGKIFSPEPSKNFTWLPLLALPETNLLPVPAKRFLLSAFLKGKPQSPPYVFEDALNASSRT